MTTLSIFLIIISRNGRMSGPAFSYVATDKKHMHTAVSFIVPGPDKMGYYYLLGGNDPKALNMIGTLVPSVSKVSDFNCQYDVRDPQYRFYQVLQFGCGNGVAYSPVIDTQNPEKEETTLRQMPGMRPDSVAA